MAYNSPMSARVERSRERYPSLAIPETPIVGNEKQDKQVAESLAQSWNAAKIRFKEATGWDLGNYKNPGKDGVLHTLKQRYGGDSKESQKRDALYGTMEKVLNGVELVAATAAQAASIVFGPAQMCFNALDILLSIPRELKKFAEDLQSLFKTIASYLENFKVFDRIDQRGMLDIALLKSNNEILINLVDVCTLACKIIQHPMKTILSNVFLKSDAIKGALTSFEDLIEKQNKLVNTIVLEATLENKAGIRQVVQGNARNLDIGRDTNLMVAGLAAESTESKNLRVDKDRIIKIDKALKLTENVVTKPLDDLLQASSIDLASTLDLVKESEDYEEWSKPETGRKILYISGGSGSGKTNVLNALARQIEDDRKKLHAQQAEDNKNKQQKNDRAIYLTYYSFSDVEKGMDRGKYETPVHEAFKVIASQLARQSTRYAGTLASSSTLEKLQKGQKTLKELWEDLKLLDLSDIAPANSIFYIFLDGLDELKDSLKELNAVMKVSKAKESAKTGAEKLRLRIIFTGFPETKAKLDALNTKSTMSEINMSEINTTLIRKYVQFMMEKGNMLQDDDEESKKIREKVLDAIPDSCNGSFTVADQKLQIVAEAIENDMDPDELIQELEVIVYEDEAKKTLEFLNTTLNPQQKEQLKELLVWAVFGRTRPELCLLESALYLQRDKKSLEPLQQKIERRFDRALEVIDPTVYPRYGIEDVFRLSSDQSLVDMTKVQKSKSAKIVPDEIENQPALDMLLSYFRTKRLEEDHEQQPQPVNTDTEDNLNPNERYAESIMLSRCFRALNDDRVRQQAKALIIYSMDYLPSHLEKFAESIDNATDEEVRVVGKGLVNFLRDCESIEAACALRLPNYYDWIYRTSIKAMKKILTNSRVQDELEHIERRWAINNTSKVSGKAAFLENIATTIARCWLIVRPFHIEPYSCYSFIDSYLDMLLDPEPETFDDEHSDSQSESSRESDTDTASVAAEETSAAQKKTQQPVVGNYTHSSFDFELVRTTLFARCSRKDGQYVEACINLNDCVSSDNGRLRWRTNGMAFDNAIDSRLLDGGDYLEMLLHDGSRQVKRRLLLDEQISNDDGKLVFLDTAIPEEEEEVDDADKETDKEVDEDADKELLGDAGKVTDEETDGRPDAEAGEGSDAGDSTAPAISYIKRAEEWAVKILKIDLDSFALERIGLACLGAGKDDLGIEYLERAAADKKTTVNLVGLARAFADKAEYESPEEEAKKANYDKAIESINGALDIFRAEELAKEKVEDSRDEERDTTTRDEVHDLYTCLLRAVKYQNLRDDQSSAIELMEEALKCRPSASDCRWQLIEALCRADRQTRAQELFEEWGSASTTLGVKEPGTFLQKKLVTDELHTQFLPLIKLMRGSTLHEKIRETIIEVIKGEDEQQNETDGVWLRYAHGLILAVEGREDNLRAAEECWIDALDVGFDLEFDDDSPMRWSSKLTSMHYFDRAVKEFFHPTSIPSQAPTVLLDDLIAGIQRVKTPKFESYSIVQQPECYNASFAVIVGQPSYAKKYLTEQMISAIDILTDDNVWNDDWGIQQLFNVFLRYGDYAGALTAWSLFDRDETRRRLRDREREKLEKEQESSKEDTKENAATNEEAPNPDMDDLSNGTKPQVDESKAETPEAEVKMNGAMHEDEKVEADEKKDKEQDEDESETHSKKGSDDGIEGDDGTMKMYGVTCDNCASYLSSYGEGSEMWWCKYCPDLVFCTECKEKRDRGVLESYKCNPEHPLLLTKHFEPGYTVDELKFNNVLIGWTLVQTDTDTEVDGVMKKVRTQTRTGGHVVKLEEWIDILREDWNIPKDVSTGIVQQ